MKDYVFYVVEFLATSYVGAALFISFGLYQIYDNVKNPQPIRWFDPLQGQIQGWLAAIGFLVVGVLIIVFKIRGDL